jgi:hypothetical protein
MILNQINANTRVNAANRMCDIVRAQKGSGWTGGAKPPRNRSSREFVKLFRPLATGGLPHSGTSLRPDLLSPPGLTGSARCDRQQNKKKNSKE